MRKLLLFLVVLMVGCSARYVIPVWKTQYDFDRATAECQQMTGKKITGFAFGNPFIVLGIMGSGAVYNGIVEYKFRSCMKDRGYETED
jgi:hypothetical protein